MIKNIKPFSDFIEKANIVHNYKYDYSLSMYVDRSTEIEIVCPIHGGFNQKPSNHLAGCGCKDCGLLSQMAKRTHKVQEVISKANDVHGNFYDYSQVPLYYKNTRTKVPIICPVHGKFFQNMNNHLNGQRCPICGDNAGHKLRTKTTEQFIEECRGIYGDKYDLSKVIYVKTKIKVDIVCRDHGVFKVTPNNFLNGCQCPKCTKYSNEVRIQEFLMNSNFNYISQKTFKGCKNKKLLRFDFYLPKYNLCIEYDGEGHYKKIFYKGKHSSDLQYVQQNDQIKNDFCKNNGIHLLRIPYWDKENIEQIITNKLIELDLQMGECK